MNPSRRLEPSKWVVPLVSALIAACSTEPAPSASRTSEPEPVAVSSSALVGVDGPLTVTAAGQVLNNYAVLAQDAAAGATSIKVSTITNLDSTLFGTLAVGDLLMII